MGQELLSHNWLKAQYEGKRVHFGGKDGGNISYTARQLMTCCGALVVDEVKPDLDLLVIGNKTKGVPAAQKQAEKLNAKGARIEIVGEDDFGKRLLPSREQMVALIRAGEKGLFGYLSGLLRVLAPKFDLTGADLSGLELTGWSFYYCDLTGADFSGISVNGSTQFGQLIDAKFDGAVLHGAQLNPGRGCSFRGARFSGNFPHVRGACDFTGAHFSESFSLIAHGSCFAGADFSHCDLLASDFSNCDLSGAKLRQIRSRGLKLVRANLRGADLSGADLLGADLGGAEVSGARFEGARLTGVNWEGVDRSQALGLPPETPPGPHLSALVPLAEQYRLNSSIVVEMPGYRLLTLAIGEKIFRWEGYCSTERWGRPHEEWDNFYGRAADAQEAMQSLAGRFPQAVPRVDSLTVQAHHCPAEQLPELTRKVLLAWCEVLGASTEIDFETVLAAPDDFRALVIARELRGGSQGVARWNARSPVEVTRAGSFQGVDLSGQALAGLNMTGVDLRKARFDEADLKESALLKCDLREASLVKADLQGATLCGKAHQARFGEARLAGANLSETELMGAIFVKADLSGARLSKADLSKADLSGADLRRAELAGANLSAARLTGTLLEGAGLEQTRYDEKTVFPEGFTPALEMQWAGKGPNPFFDTRQAPPALAPISYAEFLTRLRANTQRKAFWGASQMLKSHRYKLYCDLSDERVIGVVRSQSDSELVYACQLGNDGAFTCCTQNLKPCGGLRGKLCKHVLVLLVGLTRAGELAPERADLWMMNSRRQRPLLDKERMSEIFLRYQSARAEELDWRPTETVPEDFLAL